MNFPDGTLPQASKHMGHPCMRKTATDERTKEKTDRQRLTSLLHIAPLQRGINKQENM